VPPCLASVINFNSLSSSSGRFFTVKLPVALDPGSKISVVVETVYTHVLHPYPTQITQSEKQFVVFEGNHYFYSPYPTKTQTMRVKLASRNVESYTKLGNPSRSEDVLDYGPFKDIPAYSQVGFRDHLTAMLGWDMLSRILTLL
jgi:oligosaccharyltransferase complex subunit alpha (ribophorin I)